MGCHRLAPSRDSIAPMPWMTGVRTLWNPAFTDAAINLLTPGALANLVFPGQCPRDRHGAIAVPGVSHGRPLSEILQIRYTGAAMGRFLSV